MFGRSKRQHAHDAREGDTTVMDRDRHETGARAERSLGEERRREKFGGTNWGAAFFGWLVAVGVSILLTGIVGAIAAGVGYNEGITQSDAQRQAGTIGLVAAIVLIAVLMVGYYAGGYVAGRMSRYDGGRQGLGVWVIGLIVTILALAAGLLFGSEYNVLSRVSLPTLPISTDTLSTGGVIAAIAVLVLTLLAALAGGSVGRRYHTRVDRAGY
jgi:amino acid transporter